MEPLFLPEDEESLLPKELHAWSGNHGLNGVDHVGTDTDADGGLESSNRSTNNGGDSSENKERHQLRQSPPTSQQQQQQQHLPYDRHSVHVVTQYYVPEDPHRAREVCGVRRVRHSVRYQYVVSKNNIEYLFR